MRWEGRTTVELRVEVPQRSGVGWRWAESEELSPAGEEPAYSKRDLRRVMLAYGTLVAQLVSRGGPSAFRVTAWGKYSKRTIGAYEWAWDSAWGKYMPKGDPWVIWDAISERLAVGLKAGLIPYLEDPDDGHRRADADDGSEARERPQDEPSTSPGESVPTREPERSQERARHRHDTREGGGSPDAHYRLIRR
ncbi:hypothetical protein ACFQ7F_13105 [Streptomyces sp. NPDC056486]|uniref:hypothetical protein n=1 Tax=Streptomyces sp. NPDC056486 TaxID=3345835 RepID=UPI0036CC147C